MKAKLIKEFINFERGGEPYKVLDIGQKALLNKEKSRSNYMGLVFGSRRDY